MSVGKKLLIVLFRPFSRPKARLTVLRLTCCLLSVVAIFVLLTKKSNEKHDGVGNKDHLSGHDYFDTPVVTGFAHPAVGERLPLRYN